MRLGLRKTRASSAANATIRLRADPEQMQSAGSRGAIAAAAQVLSGGGTVAFPTETVYGLGANALDAEAVEKIFLAKQRPGWDPLIVHVSSGEMLNSVADGISDRAQRLIEAFWPGPLTLLLPRRASVALAVTAGRALVGVRMPAHPVAHALITAAGVPVAAPSANRFGHTSPTTAQHVLDDLSGRIDLVLDGGEAPCGIESTVVEAREDCVVLYRPGAIAAEQIQAAAGPVVLYSPPTSGNRGERESLPSPGVGMRHYAPNAPLVPLELASASEDAARAEWMDSVRQYAPPAAKIGVMLPCGWPLPDLFRGYRFDWGSWSDEGELAHRLFAGLRSLESMGAELILVPLPAPGGIGAAIRDRLLKAAIRRGPDEHGI